MTHKNRYLFRCFFIFCTYVSGTEQWNVLIYNENHGGSLFKDKITGFSGGSNINGGTKQSEKIKAMIVLIKID